MPSNRSTPRLDAVVRKPDTRYTHQRLRARDNRSQLIFLVLWNRGFDPNERQQLARDPSQPITIHADRDPLVIDLGIAPVFHPLEGRLVDEDSLA